MKNKSDYLFYCAETLYDSLTEYEGEHKEGFTISVNPMKGGWDITGDIKAFKLWAWEEGLESKD